MARKRSRRAFRPAVAGLESRVVLDQGVGAELIPAAAAASVAAAGSATVPAPGAGSPFLSADDWMALHQEYAARARRGGDAVVALGDSLTYLWGDPRRKTVPDTPLLPVGTAAWNATLRTDRAANFGVIGDETQNLLWRVQNGELAGRPRVAVVLIGVNDLLGGKSAGETADGIAAVVQAIREASPTTRVLLLGVLPPVSDPNAPLRVATRAVNAKIAGLAGDGVTFFDAGAAFLNPDGTFRPGLVQTPTVHLTAQGYQVLSAAVQPIIRSLLVPSRPVRPR